MSLFTLGTMPYLAIAEDQKFDNTFRYMESVVSGKFEGFYPANISVSFVNSPFKEDQSALTSFSDAFLWATDVRTKLGGGSFGELSIVYLDNFESKQDIKFEDELVKNIYDQKFALIRDGGSCTKIIATNVVHKEVKRVVFLDKNSSFDERVSCIYRHYRAMFGFIEKNYLQTFGETFIADLRLLNCRRKNPKNDDILTLIHTGKC